jgi:hypothetical protein
LLFLHGQRARFVAALAGDLDFLGSRFLTGLTAVFLPGSYHATAWQMRAFDLLIGRHRRSPFQFQSLP